MDPDETNAEEPCPLTPILRSWGTRTVRAEWCDLHGLARGHRLATRRFLEDWRGGFGFSSAAFEMNLQGDITRPGGDEMGSGWPSFFALPCAETLVRFPLESQTAQILCDLHNGGREGIESSPRAVLGRVIDRAAERGYTLRVGVEFEFYLLRADGEPLGPGRQAYRTRCGPEEDAFREDLQSLLGVMGFDVETAILEDGPGQFEITLRAGPVLAVADSSFRVKNLIKEAASKRGLLATFLSKPLSGEAGSGFHIHQQLCNREGESLFYSNDAPDHLSPKMRQYLAGQIALLRSSSAFYLPTVNAYKRIHSRGQGPLTSTWGFDNRTAALRVVGRSPASLRFENRVPGGEANPYLALAVALASGLHGIEEKLQLPVVLEGSAYERTQEFPPLPDSLQESLRELERCPVLPRWIGREIIERFIQLKQGEAERFHRAVTDWERREYFEYL